MRSCRRSRNRWSISASECGGVRDSISGPRPTSCALPRASAGLAPLVCVPIIPPPPGALDVIHLDGWSARPFSCAVGKPALIFGAKGLGDEYRASVPVVYRLDSEEPYEPE